MKETIGDLVLVGMGERGYFELILVVLMELSSLTIWREVSTTELL